MHTARTILAFLIILSVATLPVTTGAVGALKSADMTETAVMADMPDCCPGKINPCDKAMDDCQSMATCALKCFSFLGSRPFLFRCLSRACVNVRRPVRFILNWAVAPFDLLRGAR